MDANGENLVETQIAVVDSPEQKKKHHHHHHHHKHDHHKHDHRHHHHKTDEEEEEGDHTLNQRTVTEMEHTEPEESHDESEESDEETEIFEAPLGNFMFCDSMKKGRRSVKSRAFRNEDFQSPFFTRYQQPSATNVNISA